MPEVSRFFGIIIRMYWEAGAPHHKPHSKGMTMNHAIYRVESFRIAGPYTLRVRFDDEVERTIDFRPVLEGELYGPLRDRELFDRVRIDDEIHTLAWPNGADFDPVTLHDWPDLLPALEARARQWKRVSAN
jgi:hypothetical protein